MKLTWAASDAQAAGFRLHWGVIAPIPALQGLVTAGVDATA
jgi:hypothetical protein